MSDEQCPVFSQGALNIVFDGPPSPNEDEIVAGLEGENGEEKPKRLWKRSGDRRGPARNVRRKPKKRRKKK